MARGAPRARTDRAAARSGWGAFNLVEGLVDHHLLGLHHVRDGAAQLAYDLAFLVLGALLVLVGLAAGTDGAERRVPPDRRRSSETPRHVQGPTT